MPRVPLPPVRFLLVLAAVTAWLVAMRLAGTETPLSQGISNAGLVLVTAAAATACLRRARRGGDGRRSWLLIGLAVLAWSAGQVVWSWYESVLGQEVPFPSPADVGYLLAVPLLAAGLLALPSTPAALSTRLRLLLDGLLIAVSLGVISWQLVLDDLLSSAEEASLAQVITFAYPVGDVVCGTVALVALLRARHDARGDQPALVLLVAGTASFAVGDLGFAYLTLHETYYSGHLVDVGWFVGFALLGLAARAPEVAAEGREEAGTAVPVGLWAPYTVIVGALVAGVLRESTVGRLGPFIAWSMLALVGLLVVRQVLALQENALLTRGLEARVAARTAELAGQEAWSRSLLSNLSDVVAVIDERGVVTYATPSCAAHVGLTPEELQGRPLADWWSPADAVRLGDLCLQLRGRAGETRVLAGEARTREGSAVAVEATLTSLPPDAAVRGFVLTVRDVTERRRLEQELSHQAFHDALTGLANRTLFADRVSRGLDGARRSGRGLAVLFLDLDGFKAINDTLGHGAGDDLLRQVASRLVACVRPGDTVARLGGDEFAVLLEGLAPGDDGSGIATRVADALRAPVPMHGRDVVVRSSCGIAGWTGSETVEDLLRHADLAMYRAKARSAGGFALFEPGMHDELVASLRLQDDLRAALELDQLEVWYQPTLSLADGTWSGCEALLRWRHPERGLVSPLEFIPVAEETGLIVPIGAHVLREACRQTAHWRATCPELAALTVAVNVSPAQLEAADFLDTVDAALADAGLPAGALTVELTESVLVEHTEDVLALLHALTGRGVRLAIDDFGTGYSSLSYLHRFPVDVLKVDRSFVSGMSAGSSEEELARTIVRLGQSLGMTVVAEGIELQEQLSSLQVMGCDLGQGFLFSKPVLPAQLEADLAARVLVPRALPAPRPAPGSAPAADRARLLTG